MYGQEGHHPYYNRNMVTSISFVVFDTDTKKSRTLGVSPSHSAPLTSHD